MDITNRVNAFFPPADLPDQKPSPIEGRIVTYEGHPQLITFEVTIKTPTEINTFGSLLLLSADHAPSSDRLDFNILRTRGVTGTSIAHHEIHVMIGTIFSDGTRFANLTQSLWKTIWNQLVPPTLVAEARIIEPIVREDIPLNIDIDPDSEHVRFINEQGVSHGNLEYLDDEGDNEWRDEEYEDDEEDEDDEMESLFD